ncbi:MAG: restriction endonuclease subunit S [Pseudomonadota bacterium]
MELREGYKQTEVGVIPEDWDIKPLMSICSMKSGEGITNANIYEGAKYPCFGGNGLRGFTNKFTHEGRYSLIGRQGALCGNVLGVHGQFFASEHAIVVTPLKETDIEWLTYILGRMNLNQYSESSAQPGLSVSKLLPLVVPLPPSKTEQTIIANALSDADAWIQSLTRLIAKKRQIKQGAMQFLLNPYENGRLKTGWVVNSVFDLAGRKKELFDDGDWIEAEHITTQGIRLIQTGNIGVGHYVEKDAKKYIYEKSFKKLRCKQLYKGDLLICRLAEPAGRACIFPDIGEKKVVTSVDVTIFRPRSEVADRVYLTNFFSTPDWFKKVNESVGGTTHKRISRGSLGHIEVTLPPIEEQRTTATILSDMDAEITALKTKLSKAQQIKQGMMQNLLTGKVRLVKVKGIAS